MLPAVYNGLVRMLPDVTNVGGSWDERDLYWVMEQAGLHAQAAHPEFLCRSGCNHCCTGDQMPLVSSIEWRVLYPTIYGLPEGSRRLIVRQLREQWGPILHMLLKGHAGYLDGEQLRIVPKAVESCVHCPLLLFGKCSAYAGRPFQCRSFGTFARQAAGQVEPFMCGQARAHIDRNFPTDTALPILNPYESKLVALEGPNPVAALLPLWLAAHVEGADFSQTCTLQPDFGLAVSRLQATLGLTGKV